MRSFRSALALRIVAQTLGVALVGVAGAGALFRLALLRGVDASLHDVADIAAKSGADPVSPEFRFPPGVPAAQGRLASNGAPPSIQLLSADGRIVARSDTARAPHTVPAEALATARGGGPGYATHVGPLGPVRSIVYPLGGIGPAHQGHFLQVSVPLEGLRKATIRFTLQTGLLALGAALLAGLLSWRTADKALEPALVLARDVESIGVADLGKRVGVPGGLAEFERLAVACNGLLARVEHAVTGTRRFTSDASHELRAPLTVLRGELELALSRKRTVEEHEEVLRRCLDEVLRLARLADDLLTLTRVEGGVLGGKRSPVDLDEVVERGVARKAPMAGARKVQLDVSGSAGTISGDVDVLLRAMDGLLEHAIMATPEGGTVRVRLAAAPRPSVMVADGGSGLKQEDISGVFQRFYRSGRARSASGESGLGLPIARAVAIAHGGSLDYSGNDPGAAFTLSFPAAS